MPAKFKQSEVKIDPKTKKRYNVHHYISHISTDELVETMNKTFTKPKIKDKIRKELVKRGVV